jgi:gliding motility-associated-like protein
MTISGHTLAVYSVNQYNNCLASPTPTDSIYWTNCILNGVSNGFIKHTFNLPQTNVSIWYTIINDDDIGLISINGGGILSLISDTNCINVSGNLIGPYVGPAIGPYKWGDALVSIKSTLPFTEVTLVMVSDQSGICTGDCNSVIINESEAIDNSIVFDLPNVITPNGDGVNDLFVPVKSKGIESVHTTIYNRWGNNLFESDDVQINWSGDDHPGGTYFYITNYIDINGNALSKKGVISLFR